MKVTLKSWMVDALATELYQGVRGPSYWFTRVISFTWAGFKSA